MKDEREIRAHLSSIDTAIGESGAYYGGSPMVATLLTQRAVLRWVLEEAL